MNISNDPLVTFAVFAFNQESFIGEAILSAFSQDYPRLQIILSDDCSSDKTYEIMQTAVRGYRGPHEIILNQNCSNLGIGRHVNRVMELADGEWIVGAAGDDISDAGRTSRIVEAVLNGGERIKSVWSRAQHMTHEGGLIQKYELCTGEAYTTREIVSNKRVVMGCSHAWHRSLFDFFGPLGSSVVFEDNAISFRSFLIGEILYIDDLLVYYRQHNKNITNYTKINKGFDARMIQRNMASVFAVCQRIIDFSIYVSKHNNLKMRFFYLYTLLFLKLIKESAKFIYRKYEYTKNRNF